MCAGVSQQSLTSAFAERRYEPGHLSVPPEVKGRRVVLDDNELGVVRLVRKHSVRYAVILGAVF